MLSRKSITIRTVELQTVELTNEQRTQVAIETLLEAGGLHDEHFIEDGYLKEWIEYHHGSPSRSKVRVANETDSLIFESIGLIRKAERLRQEARKYKSPEQLKTEIEALQKQLAETEQSNSEKAA